MAELEVRGPWTASSYYDAADAGERFTPDGWFRTGDIASIDARGYIAIRDRAKDVIKSGGEWISSVALENEIMGLPGVAEAAVVGIAHPRWDERPLALVVPREGYVITTEEVRAQLAWDESLCTAGGALHGGALMGLADTLGGVCAFLNLPEGAATTTIESKTNFFAAIPLGETAFAECTPLHRGRSTMVWQTRITRQDGRLAAVVTQTQMVLPRR
jgi:uncharacterized protein (TIGR00369 family)